MTDDDDPAGTGPDVTPSADGPDDPGRQLVAAIGSVVKMRTTTFVADADGAPAGVEVRELSGVLVMDDQTRAILEAGEPVVPDPEAVAEAAALIAAGLRGELPDDDTEDDDDDPPPGGERAAA